MTANNWTYQGNNIAELPEDCVGFVYEITNTINGRMYIGKKLAKFKRSKAPLKGRRNRRRYKVESDWQEYYGSSDDLTMDIKRLGSTASQNQNCPTWRHESSSHVRCWKPKITTMVISV
jgi:hypothetical protein